MGYYTGWQQDGYTPEQIDWTVFTHIVQFSLMTNRNGTLNYNGHSLTPAKMQALVNAAHAHGRKALIGVGGVEDQNWNGACAPATRATFVSNLLAIVRQYGYDGIDLDIEQDWQAPGHADYVACVAAIRAGLDTISPRPLLTEPGDPDWQQDMLFQVHQYLDQINLMSYWQSAAEMSSRVANYTSLGVPKAKLGVGIGVGEPDEYDISHQADCAAKAQYVLSAGLGGIMTWTVQGDTPTCFNGIRPYVP